MSRGIRFFAYCLYILCGSQEMYHKINQASIPPNFSTVPLGYECLMSKKEYAVSINQNVKNSDVEVIITWIKDLSP
jgi:hypothetical protein